MISTMDDKKQAHEFCAIMDSWAEIAQPIGWNTVRAAISKSCLLDRMMYGGEKPSQTPCPVHNGVWSGIHLGWPGQKWENGSDVQTSPLLQKWHDQGCRCYKHSCGCTTGWQPE